MDESNARRVRHGLLEATRCLDRQDLREEERLNVQILANKVVVAAANRMAGQESPLTPNIAVFT